MADVAKAGWLLRQTSFLKRWKLSWYSLTIDGYFRQFESPDSVIAKNTIFVPRDAIAIKIGSDTKVKPPENRSADYLIKIITRKSEWILCAESIDEMLAWQLALEQSRVVNRPQRNLMNSQMPAYLMDALENNPNNGYPMYYVGNYNGQYPSRIVHTDRGPVTVVYINDPYYYRRGYRGYGGLGYGALGGALVASTLLWPFWFPFYWC